MVWFELSRVLTVTQLLKRPRWTAAPQPLWLHAVPPSRNCGGVPVEPQIGCTGIEIGPLVEGSRQRHIFSWIGLCFKVRTEFPKNPLHHPNGFSNQVAFRVAPIRSGTRVDKWCQGSECPNSSQYHPCCLVLVVRILRYKPKRSYEARKILHKRPTEHPP